jgi:hypothetical protein
MASNSADLQLVEANVANELAKFGVDNFFDLRDIAVRVRCEQLKLEIVFTCASVYIVDSRYVSIPFQRVILSSEAVDSISFDFRKGSWRICNGGPGDNFYEGSAWPAQVEVIKESTSSISMVAQMSKTPR